MTDTLTIKVFVSYIATGNKCGAVFSDATEVTALDFTSSIPINIDATIVGEASSAEMQFCGAEYYPFNFALP